MDPRNIFSAVVASPKVKSMTRLAELLDEPIPTVNNWRTRGIPAKHCKAVERLTGISVRRLRPEDWHHYWPDAPKRTKASA